MKEWTVPQGKRGQRYIVVKSDSVVVGGHWGSGHTDNAHVLTHEQFLVTLRDGDDIASTFGISVVAEIMNELGSSAANDWLQDRKPPQTWVGDCGTQRLEINATGVWLTSDKTEQRPAFQAAWSHREFAATVKAVELTKAFGKGREEARSRARKLNSAISGRDGKKLHPVGNGEQWREKLLDPATQAESLEALRQKEIDIAAWLVDRVTIRTDGERWRPVFSAMTDADKRLLLEVVDGLPGYARGDAARRLAELNVPGVAEMIGSRLGKDAHLDLALLEALALLGPAGASAIPAVLKRLAVPHLRENALATLRALEARGIETATAVAPLLADHHKRVVVQACGLLGDLGSDTQVASQQLVELLLGEPEYQTVAADALSRSGVVLNVTDALIEGLRSPRYRVWTVARTALVSALALDSKVVGDALLSALDEPSKILRERIISLAESDLRPDDRLRVLEKGLSDSLKTLREAAARGLAKLGGSGDEVIARTLETGDKKAKIAALRALVHRHEIHQELAPQVIALTEDSDSGIRNAAIQACQAGSMGYGLIGASLLRALEEPETRVSAINALGQFPEAHDRIQTYLSDPEQKVRTAAQITLRIHAPDRLAEESPNTGFEGGSVYMLERGKGAPSGLDRVGGVPPGITAADWPLDEDGTPFVCLLTVRLAGRDIPGVGSSAAVAVFVDDPNDVPFEAFSDRVRVVLLSEQQLKQPEIAPPAGALPARELTLNCLGRLTEDQGSIRFEVDSAHTEHLDDEEVVCGNRPKAKVAWQVLGDVLRAADMGWSYLGGLLVHPAAGWHHYNDVGPFYMRVQEDLFDEKPNFAGGGFLFVHRLTAWAMQ